MVSICNPLSHDINAKFKYRYRYRVESGSDDPDNLGHLGHIFGGSNRSHLQTKLSGCDLDIMHIFFRKQCWYLVMSELWV